MHNPDLSFSWKPYEGLLRHLASQPIGLMHYGIDLWHQGEGEYYEQLKRLIETCPRDEGGREFALFKEDAPFYQCLDSIRAQVYRIRLEQLLSPSERPAPYHLDEFSGVALSDGGLVQASDLEWYFDTPVKGRFGFSLCSPQPSENAMYWTQLALAEVVGSATIRFRLDPLMVVPRENVISIGHRAWIHGRPLDCGRLRELKQPEFGAWIDPKTDRQTEFMWVPRGDEIHFECEEIGHHEAAGLVTGRYFHAILSRNASDITHTDGAIIICSPEELAMRQQAPMWRRSAKFGKRIKVFRADGSIPPDHWSTIAASFFVWNDDVSEYFGSPTFRSLRN